MIALVSALVLVSAFLAIGLLCARAGGLLVAVSHLIVVTVYCAGWLATILPVRFLLIPLLLTAVATLRSRRGDSPGVLLLLCFGVAFVAAAALSFMGPSWWSATGMERTVRYGLLFTSAFWLGVEMRRGPSHTVRFGAVYLGWSLLAAALAAVEFIRDQTLIERTDFSGNSVGSVLRGGHVRAVLLSEHPLVLATLLVLALPVALRLGKRDLRLPLALLLLAGIYSTQSRGPLIVGGVYVVARLLWGMKTRDEVTPRSLILPIGLTALVVTGIALIANPASTEGQLSSRDPAEASAQYRGVLYAKVGESLTAHPLGWGPAGLPRGVYLVRSGLGTVDLANTIDSEPVLLVLEYGILGLLAFLLVLALSLDRFIRVGDWASDALVVLVTCSTVLAVHSWTGLGVMAFILIGSSVVRPGEYLGAAIPRQRSREATQA